MFRTIGLLGAGAGLALAVTFGSAHAAAPRAVPTLQQEQPTVTPTPKPKTQNGQRGWHGGRGTRGGRDGGALLAAASSVTGLTAEQVRAELAAGKTLAQIAQENGSSADALIQAARSAYQASLAEAVTAGRRTQAQADAALTRFDQTAPEIVNTIKSRQRGTKPATPTPTPESSGA